MENIAIKIKEVGNNVEFHTNYKIKDEELMFDLVNTKKIFEMNPIESHNIELGDSKYVISYVFDFNKDNQEFKLEMFKDQTVIDSKLITPREMLEVLLDAYEKNIYISKHTIINENVSNMFNEHINSLLQEGLFPNTPSLLMGEGVVYNKDTKSKIALFERILLNPKDDKVLFCECVGDVQAGTLVNISIKTNIGIVFELNNVVFSKENIETGDVLGVKYIGTKISNNVNIIKDSNLSKHTDELEYDKYNLTKQSNGAIIGFSHTSQLIRSCTQYLNQNSMETLNEYVRDKKEELYKEEPGVHLEQEIEDLFDDLF